MPLIRSQNIRPGRLHLDDTAWITHSFHSGNRKSQLQPGDILITRVGANAGDVCRVPDGTGPLHLSSAVFARPKPGMSRFIDFWLRSPGGQRRLLETIVGSVSERINTRDAEKIAVPLPPQSELATIVETLESLDDKIELNRRMNQTLEAMAQTIFRDWFFDFGPARRKLAGEANPVAIMGGLILDPARAAEIAALFPALLADDGLPEGWTDCPIGDQVEIAGGSTPSTADDSLWNPAEHRWATPKDLSNMSDLALFETGRRISSAGLAKITSGLLPAGTVLLSSRAPIGYLAIAQEPVAINQGFIALKPTTDHGSAYLYLWCKANMEAILANANGSTFQEISKKNFRPITSAAPDNPAILRAFGEIAQPLVDRIVSAAGENRTLAETRDYLLPRLMSGEVRVTPSITESAAA